MTTASFPTVRVALSDVWRTARVPKIAPIPLLAWSGYALAHGHDARRLALVTLGIVAVTILVTRLNVLTDEALDRSSRPELARSLRRSASWIAIATVVELGLFGVVLAALGADARWALLGLAAFGVLYSYNFLSAHPVRTRWKTHWLGHALAFVGSYAALWTAGAWATDAVVRAPVWLVAIATGVADYAVYVGECAIDHEEESRAGLRTTAALLGPRSASFAALALFAVAIVLHVPLLVRGLALALLPPLIVRGAMLAALAWAEHGGRASIAHRIRLRGADLVFLGARVWTFAALVVVAQ